MPLWHAASAENTAAVAAAAVATAPGAAPTVTTAAASAAGARTGVAEMQDILRALLIVVASMGCVQRQAQ